MDREGERVGDEERLRDREGGKGYNFAGNLVLKPFVGK